MACPTCGHTMQCVDGVNGDTFWCPRCGTLKIGNQAELVEGPKLVTESRHLLRLCQEALERYSRGGRGLDEVSAPSIGRAVRNTEEACTLWSPMSHGSSEVTLPPTITGQWLRETGWKYHAIRKYFYLTTSCDTLLLKKQPDGWTLQAVGSAVDPREYDDAAATLTDSATRQTVRLIVSMCNDHSFA